MFGDARRNSERLRLLAFELLLGSTFFWAGASTVAENSCTAVVQTQCPGMKGNPDWWYNDSKVCTTGGCAAPALSSCEYRSETCGKTGSGYLKFYGSCECTNKS